MLLNVAHYFYQENTIRQGEIMKHILSIQSHVVFGYAGNKAATFPMQLLGIDVWALNTVQFSNHTQYGRWKGMVLPQGQIREVVQGLLDIDSLKLCDAVLSGYIGSAEQVQDIINVVREVKKANPNALYLCDPVMGHPEKGCIVATGVKEALCQLAIPEADILAPNLVELQVISGHNVDNFEQAIIAVKAILAKGIKKVLVKHLSHVGKEEDSFEMLLGTTEGIWHIVRPLYPFKLQPVGVGDLTSGIFLANLLNGKSDIEAFEHTANAVNEVMKLTSRSGLYELQIVAARNEILNPNCRYKAVKII